MNTPIRHRGLTLVEACMALAVLAIVATLAVPSLATMLERRRLAGWAALVMQDLRLARTEAIVRNESVRMAARSTAGHGCYIVHTGPAGSCACVHPGQPARCDEGATAIRTVWLPESSGTIVGTQVASMLFDPLGTVTPTGSWHIRQGPDMEVRHVVNLMGRIRTCAATPLTGNAWEAC